MMNNKPIKLLVVEDNPADYFLLEIKLRQTSFAKKITWANCYEKAVEVLSAEPFDIVIIDYMLGVFTGIELVSYINEKFPFTPTILLTGLKATAIDDEALKSGVYDYLAKDQYTTEDIGRSIRYAVEKSKVLKSLKESENKFKNLFENSVDYIFLVDAGFKIIDANKSALKLFNYSGKEELTGVTILDYISPGIFEESKTIDTSVEVELTIPELDKKAFCILNSSVVDEEAQLYQLVLHDITERKLNEQKAKLLETQALTGKVARIIAHEIKNPLTSIHLSLAELRDILPEIVTGKDDPIEFLDIIERNSKRINILIEDLLNATRFDTINFSELYLHELLHETLSHVHDRIHLKKIKIEKQFHENLIIRGDREKLVIALLNIMVNAVEAMADREDGKLQIITLLEDGQASITITDNGKGIQQQDINKLFEPFFTSKKGGTGLGLAATYNIIAKHEGIIRVKSDGDTGTSFVITLPVLK